MQVQQFVDRTNITVDSNRIYSDDPPEFKLTQNKFMVGINIQQSNYTTNPYFNITMQQRVYMKDSDGNRNKTFVILVFSQITKFIIKIDIPLEPCTLEHWGVGYEKGIEEKFKSYTLNNYLCPRIGTNLTIGGQYESEYFKHIRFLISKCNPHYQQLNNIADKYWKPTCQSDEAINSFVSSQAVRVQFQLTNVNVNPQQPENLISQIVSSDLFFQIQPQKIYRTADIYFTEYEIETDESLSPSKDVSLTDFAVQEYGDYREQFTLDSNSGQYAAFYFHRSRYTQFYRRSYQKVDDLVSQLGGFVQSVIMVASLIVGFYNQEVYTIELANQIYDYDLEDKNAKKEHLEQDSPVHTKHGINNNMIQSDMKKIIPCSTDQQKQPSKTDIQKITKKYDFLKQKSIEKLQQSIFVSQNQNASFKDQSSPQNQSKINCSPNSNVEQVQSECIYSSQPHSVFKQQYSQIQQGNEKQGNYSPFSSFQNAQYKNTIRTPNPFLNSMNTQFETIYLDEEKNTENKIAQDNNFQEQQISNSKSVLIIPNHVKIEMDDKKQDCQQCQMMMQSEEINQESKRNNHSILTKVEELSNTETNTDQSQKYNPQNQNGQSSQSFKKYLGIQHVSDQFSKLIQLSNLQKDKNCQHTQNLDVRRESIHNTQNENIANFGINLEINQNENMNKGLVNKRDSSVFLNAYRAQMRKDYLKKHVDKIIVKHKKLKISCSYFIYRLSCGKFFKTKENLMIRQSRRLLNKDIDIISILNKIKEIEKIKYIMFNHDQMTLFNYFPKPLLCLDKNENINLKTQLCKLKKRQVKKLKIDPKLINVVNRVKTKFKNISKKQDENAQQRQQRFSISLNRQSDQMHEIEELYTAYEHLTQLKDKHRVDDVLINMLENNMKQVFEKSYLMGFGIDKLQKLIFKRSQTKKNLTSNFKKLVEVKKQEEAKKHQEDKKYEEDKDQLNPQKPQLESQNQGLVLFEQISSESE